LCPSSVCVVATFPGAVVLVAVTNPYLPFFSLSSPVRELRVEEFKCPGTTITDQNSIQEEIKS